jgi:hypothetical protein
MTPDEFNQLAWSDFITWAWNEPQMRTQFTAATGIEIERVTAPINAAIDAATGAAGARDSIAARFVEWATRDHWGVEHAPASYQKMLANKEAKT